jgi:hypothetical protein
MKPNQLFQYALCNILNDFETPKTSFEVVDVKGHSKDSIEVDVDVNKIEIKSGDKLVSKIYIDGLHTRNIKVKYVDEMEALLIKMEPKETKVKIEVN